MIVTVHIDRQGPGEYHARPHVDGVEVSAGSVYGSLEEAIRGEATAIPGDFAGFVEVHYGGVTSGTLSLNEAAQGAAAIADRLVQVIAMLHVYAAR